MVIGLNVDCAVKAQIATVEDGLVVKIIRTLAIQNRRFSMNDYVNGCNFDSVASSAPQSLQQLAVDSSESAIAEHTNDFSALCALCDVRDD